MRFFSAIIIPLTLTFLTISNAIPTDQSLLNHGHHLNSRSIPKTTRTDLLPLGPRSLSTRDLSTPLKIIRDSLKILNKNMTIAIPTDTSLLAWAKFYAQVNLLILKNIPTNPQHYYSFTLGAYTMTISCVAEAIPWSLLSDIVNDLRQWSRDQWAPVAAKFSLAGTNPYFVAAPTLIVVSIVVDAYAALAG